MDIIVAKKADKPLQNKRYHGDKAVFHLLRDELEAGIAFWMSEAQDLIEYPHVSHDAIHAVIIVAR